MKIFKIGKNNVHWDNEMEQINFKWNLPILCDDKFNVIAGNSLRNSLPDVIYIIVIPENDKLRMNLNYIESKVVEENSDIRFNVIYSEVKEYLGELRKPIVKNLELFDTPKEYGLISEENYELRRDRFKSHGIKNDEDDDYQLYLPGFEPEIIEDVVKIKDRYEIEVDLEILKELI